MSFFLSASFYVDCKTLTKTSLFFNYAVFWIRKYFLWIRIRWFGSGWPFNFGSGQIPIASWTLLVIKILNFSVKTVTLIFENFFVYLINSKDPHRHYRSLFGSSRQMKYKYRTDPVGKKSSLAKQQNEKIKRNCQEKEHVTILFKNLTFSFRRDEDGTKLRNFLCTNRINIEFNMFISISTSE